MAAAYNGEAVMRAFAAQAKGKYDLTLLMVDAEIIYQLLTNTDGDIRPDDAPIFLAVRYNFLWLSGDNVPKAPGLQALIGMLNASPMTDAIAREIYAWLDRNIAIMQKFKCDLLEARAKAVEGDETVYVNSQGDMEWRGEGKLSRENDLPAIIESDGDVGWYKNGVAHRDDDKPAAFSSGEGMAWLKEGKLHREGGKPAIIRTDGSVEYWLNGVQYFPQESKQPIVGTIAEEKAAWKAAIAAIPEDVKLGAALVEGRAPFKGSRLQVLMPDIEWRITQLTDSEDPGDRTLMLTALGRDARKQSMAW